MPTGKLDFSFNNKKVVFHTSTLDFEGGFFSEVNDRMNMNVYILDLDKKTLTQMTQNGLHDNSYYPGFQPDGTIVYSQINGDGTIQFIRADPSKGITVPFDVSKITKDKHLLGRLWAKKCLNVADPSTAFTSTVALSLDPDKCKKLVENAVQEDSNLTSRKSALLAACPSVKNSALTERNSTQELTASKPGQAVMATKCSACHGDFSLSQTLTHSIDPGKAKEILRRIYSEDPSVKMPRIGHLDNDEKQQIKDYLESL
jgi:hypothetical protein